MNICGSFMDIFDPKTFMNIFDQKHSWTFLTQKHLWPFMTKTQRKRKYKYSRLPTTSKRIS